MVKTNESLDLKRILFLLVLIAGCGRAKEPTEVDQATRFAGCGCTKESTEVDQAIRIAGPRLRLTGHTEAIRSVAFSPDGKIVAAGGNDGSVRFWSIPSGKPLLTIQNIAYHVEAIAFSPNGKLLATAGSIPVYSIDGKTVEPGSLERLDFTVKIWNVQNGKLLKGLSKPDPSVIKKWNPASLGYYHIISADCLDFSPDGKLLAVGYGDAKVRIFNAENSEELKVLEGHGSCIASVAFSPDGTQIATGSLDNTARIWNVATGKQERVFEMRCHHNAVWCVDFSPAGNHIAAACNDHTARQWGIDGDQQDKVFCRHESSVVMTVAYSPDGEMLASGGHDGRVILWNVHSAKPKQVITGKFAVESVAFSPDGKMLAVGRYGYGDGNTDVTVWDIAE